MKIARTSRRGTLPLALVFLGLTGPGCRPTARGETMSTSSDQKPSHAQVVAAIASSGDAELRGLVTRSEDYVLRRQDRTDLTGHTLYRVLMTNTDHPMSFWLAVPNNGVAPAVLSQNLSAVHAFLRHEPALAALEGDALIAAFFDLYRHQGVRARIAAQPTPSVERGSARTTLRFGVAEAHMTETWTVTLPTQGQPSIAIEAAFTAPPRSAP